MQPFSSEPGWRRQPRFPSGPSGLPTGWRVLASQDGNAPYFFTDLPTDGATARSVAHDESGNLFVGGTYVDPVTG